MRILILEDDPLTALDIKGLVESAVEAEIVMCASVRSTKSHLTEPFDFAFLDIDVADGKSFEIAELLLGAGVPFVFVSGSTPSTVPAKFKSATFVAKPFSGQALLQALKADRIGGASVGSDARAS
jgi:DNA-binding LytR/AlgR family response regulator